MSPRHLFEAAHATSYKVKQNVYGYNFPLSILPSIEKPSLLIAILYHVRFLLVSISPIPMYFLIPFDSTPQSNFSLFHGRCARVSHISVKFVNICQIIVGSSVSKAWRTSSVPQSQPHKEISTLGCSRSGITNRLLLYSSFLKRKVVNSIQSGQICTTRIKSFCGIDFSN